VASRLQAAVRETDRVVRLGGDEFAVLMPDVTNPADLDPICSRICQSVIAPVVHGQNLLQVGASIGAACAPLHANSPDTLYKMADIVLYEAKASGRNCWRTAGARHVQAVLAKGEGGEGGALPAREDALQLDGVDASN
jgi:diguanylate cyclase (GGDEF)-like protein